MSDYQADPDISQLAPATGQVGTPSDGTYGAQAQLDQLEASLPGVTPPAESTEPAFPAGGGELPLPPPSGDLPRSIMAPSNRPNEPLATPLQPQVPIGETPSEQHIQMLQAWARDPSKRETTRMWAQTILDSLGLG